MIAYPGNAGAVESREGENASNPLAAVNNIDLRYQYFDLDGPERNVFSLEGAHMATPKLKLRYELHYWDTDVTGRFENDWSSLVIKPIWLPIEGLLGEGWKYRVALGLEWIIDFGNDQKGIGSGSDQIAPFTGLALMSDKGLVLIPLVQHFIEYSGDDVSTTALRLIGIQKLPERYWLKLDAKIPVEWENDNKIPATTELQLGKMIASRFGVYVDGLFGVGGDRPYDWGTGVGLRFMY
jgi:hypothetical protein